MVLWCLPFAIVIGWISSIKVPTASDFYGNDPRNKPSAQLKRWEAAAAACEKDLQRLQPQYRVDGVVIEKGALDERAIAYLLAISRLDFVEMKVRGTVDEPYLLPPHGPVDHPWVVNQRPGAYVRFQLREKASGKCGPETLTGVVDGWLKFADMPSNQCLQMTNVDTPDSLFALDYEPIEGAAATAPQGHYVLIDLRTQSIIARVTSSDAPRNSEPDSISNGRLSRPDCRSPMAALADRLVGDDNGKITR